MVDVPERATIAGDLELLALARVGFRHRLELVLADDWARPTPAPWVGVDGGELTRIGVGGPLVDRVELAGRDVEVLRGWLERSERFNGPVDDGQDHFAAVEEMRIGTVSSPSIPRTIS